MMEFAPKQIGSRHFLYMLPLAAVVHAGVAAAIFWIPPAPGAQAVGMGGIEISLGPSGGAPGDATTSAPLQSPSVQPQETDPIPPQESAVEAPLDTVVDEIVETAAVAEIAEAQDAMPEEPELVPVTEFKQAPPEFEAIAQEKTAKVVLAQPTPPKPKRKPRPPEPAKVQPPKPVVVKHPIPAPPKVMPLQETALLQPNQQLEKAKPPSVAGAAGKSGTADGAESSNANATTGGGAPGAASDYMSYLLAWLQKHKEYPSSARRRRQEGTALLYFEMDRQGIIKTFNLRKSSGHKLLDKEVISLIKRASPLPIPPAEVAGERIKLVVPVQFFLR